MKISKIGKNSIRIEVPTDDIPYIIGRKGKTITELEKRIGMKIDVKPLSLDSVSNSDSQLQSEDEQIPIDIRFTKTHVILSFPESHKGMNIEVRTEDKSLFTGSIGKKGEIKIERPTTIAKDVIKLLNRGETIFATLK